MIKNNNEINYVLSGSTLEVNVKMKIIYILYCLQNLITYLKNMKTLQK